MNQPWIDLSLLLRLRVTVGRLGDMDLARWWNTRGQLGALGLAALKRGVPCTHRFALARSVFAVAAHRCRELFDPPKRLTIWSLPASVDEELDSRFEAWLDDATAWAPSFVAIEPVHFVSASERRERPERGRRTAGLPELTGISKATKAAR